ncbi:hypothetical protein Cabys_2824 [Caldithrix abyssi DSM 13497]|uniref:Uncharacterized protein n=1 Tax=Caldithrix abyssi DSM 13497 TaxID=880073 RepID=A0A1J1CAZ9_CALAY|nr:hypothetical protein Cabys_2824 [Caldithrix abyssi DSM 13497]
MQATFIKAAKAWPLLFEPLIIKPGMFFQGWPSFRPALEAVANSV